MAIRRLKRDNLIAVDPDGHIRLTPDGRDIAFRVLHRHHLIERMLTEVFGMEWYKVHEEAERLEHAVSEDFEQLLVDKLGAGRACPHGNLVEVDTPEQRRQRGWMTLDEVAPERMVHVMSVYERDRQLLEFLHGLSIQPGAALKVTGQNYDETVSFRVDGKTGQLGKTVARKVWVL
jgi:DtxR family Mn-dependent transcriptional regulator